MCADPPPRSATDARDLVDRDTALAGLLVRIGVAAMSLCPDSVPCTTRTVLEVENRLDPTARRNP